VLSAVIVPAARLAKAHNCAVERTRFARRSPLRYADLVKP
jgi:hypothetical protein